MKNITKLIAKYADKDILYINTLMLKNYKAYLAMKCNYKKIASNLYNDYSIYIYDEKNKATTLSNAIGYLKVKYGNEISYKNIWENESYIINSMYNKFKISKPKEILKKAGFILKEGKV